MAPESEPSIVAAERRGGHVDNHAAAYNFPFTEEDIMARKLVGPKSKVKMLISRPLGLKK